MNAATIQVEDFIKKKEKKNLSVTVCMYVWTYGTYRWEEYHGLEYIEYVCRNWWELEYIVRIPPHTRMDLHCNARKKDSTDQ